MSWIQLHSELKEHPKTLALAKRLQISHVQAIGHLSLLWLWAVDYAPSGDLSEVTSADIAKAAAWEGRPEDFLEALQSPIPPKNSAWIDASGALHDWEDFAGRLQEARKKDRDRKAKEKNKTPPDLTNPGIMEIIGHYHKWIKSRANDGSGSLYIFQRTIAGLLWKFTAEELKAAINNYLKERKAIEKPSEEKYRLGLQSFFGPKLQKYKDYLPQNFKLQTDIRQDRKFGEATREMQRRILEEEKRLCEISKPQPLAQY